MPIASIEVGWTTLNQPHPYTCDSDVVNHFGPGIKRSMQHATIKNLKFSFLGMGVTTFMVQNIQQGAF